MSTLKQENKQYNFFLRYSIPQTETLESSLIKIEPFFRGFHTASNSLQVFNNDSQSLVCVFFKLLDRKRSSHLKKSLSQVYPSLQFEIIGTTQDKFSETLYKFSESSSWNNIENIDRITYQAKDLRLFSNPKNFHPWQKTLLSYIFDNDGNFKEFNNRELLFFLDHTGNKGKSTFVKYLAWKHQDDIVRVSFGQTGQLRSALIDAGRRRVYMIDIPRTIGKNDSIQDMLVTAEELSCGMLTSPFYGKFMSSFFEPPLVIIFANNHLPYEQLSLDRWNCYEVNNKFKAVPIRVENLIAAKRRKKL